MMRAMIIGGLLLTLGDEEVPGADGPGSNTEPGRPTSSESGDQPNPISGYEEALASAYEQLEAESYDAAVRAFRDGFARMPAEVRTGVVGEETVLSAADAAEQHWRATGETESLVVARDLLGIFLFEVEAAGAPAGTVPPDLARERRARIESHLLSASAEGASESAPVEEERAPTSSLRPLVEPQTVNPREGTEVIGVDPKRRKIGLGLTIGGGAMVLGGIALVAVGTQHGAWYMQKVMEAGIPQGSLRWDQEFVKATEISFYDIAIGASMIAVGGAYTAAGSVLLTRPRRARTRHEFRASKRSAMIFVHHRF